MTARLLYCAVSLPLSGGGVGGEEEKRKSVAKSEPMVALRPVTLRSYLHVHSSGMRIQVFGNKGRYQDSTPLKIGCWNGMMKSFSTCFPIWFSGVASLPLGQKLHLTEWVFRQETREPRTGSAIATTIRPPSAYRSQKKERGKALGG